MVIYCFLFPTHHCGNQDALNGAIFPEGIQALRFNQPVAEFGEVKVTKFQ